MALRSPVGHAPFPRRWNRPSSNSPGTTGLDSQEALARLRLELEEFVAEWRGGDGGGVSMLSKLSQAAHFDRWSLALLLVCAVSLLASQIVVLAISPAIVIEASILLAFAAFNVWLSRRESRLKREEALLKVLTLVNEVRRCESEDDSDAFDAALPPLYLPNSPSISLQWTYRDRCLVNLPTALLVKGDVVVLRPGSVAPGDCRRADDNDDENPFLFRGERFLPCPSDTVPPTLRHAPLPRPRRPASPRPFVLLETPLIRNVASVVDRFSGRPNSLVHTVHSHVRLKLIEKIFIPAFFVVYIIVVLVLFFLHRHVPAQPRPHPWSLLLLRHLVFCLLPVLPVARVAWFFAVESFASASVVNVLEEFGERKKGRGGREEREKRGKREEGDEKGETGESGRVEAEDLKGQFLPGSDKLLELESLSIQGDGASSIVKDFSQELLRLPKTPMRSRRFFSTLFRRVRGPTGSLDRACELAANLATVSSICCVDKYGVLSFADPTPEKVFFITSRDADGLDDDPAEDEVGVDAEIKSASRASVVSLFAGDSAENAESASTKEIKSVFKSKTASSAGDSAATFIDAAADDDESGIFGRETRVEVLNISHKEEKCGYRLQFDDPRWRKHVANLKPLGLHILVNVCNKDVIAKNVEFSDHLACVSHRLCRADDDVSAAAAKDPAHPLQILERRCMCDLAAMIGFAPSAKEIFALQHQAYTYRKVKPESRRRPSLVAKTVALQEVPHAPLRTRHFVRQKSSLPSAAAVLMRERDTDAVQLMSQGTADVVLDTCSDFWDGSDLSHLDDVHRKKILDFFQRNNLAAHCSAMSYCPLGCAAKLDGTFDSEVYVELPADSKDALDALLSPAIVRKLGDRMTSPFCAQDRATPLWRRGLPVQPFVPSAALTDKSGDRYFSEECLDRRRDGDKGDDSGTTDPPRDSGDAASAAKPQTSRVRLVSQLTADRATETSERRAASSSPLPTFTSESNSLESISERVRVQFEQIFLGMVTMQYQARLDVIHLIEELEKACIRFVHFSKENELRSRVFSEKMGLEAGWNCHISLEEEAAPESADAPPAGDDPDGGAVKRTSGVDGVSPASSGVGFEEAHRASASPSHSAGELPRRASCPSALHQDASQVRFHEDDFIIDPSSTEGEGEASSSAAPLVSPTSVDDAAEDYVAGLEEEEDPITVETTLKTSEAETTETILDADAVVFAPFRRRASTTRSERVTDDDDANSALTGNSSHPTTSGMTSSTDRFPIDFSNRAKLPRGVGNVRPHLEHVDNVPLLVSLFTDCTPATSTEMMRIMQEYGECLLCLGSAANFVNARQFSTADVAFAVEPMYPRVCSMETGDKGTTSSSRLVREDDTVVLSKTLPSSSSPPSTPLWLSDRLNSLACVALFRRGGDVFVAALVAVARHVVIVAASAAEFQLCAQLTLVALHAAPLALLAASPLNAPLILWMCLVILPLLSASLLGCPLDPFVMTLSPPKKDFFSTSYFLRHCLVSIAKFGPTVLVRLATFYLILHSFCNEGEVRSDAATPTLETSTIAAPMIETATTTPSSRSNETRAIFSSSPLGACSPFLHFSSIHSNATEATFFREGAGVETLALPGDAGIAPGVVLAQNVVAFFLVVDLVIASSVFVHRYHSVWQRNPSSNVAWTIASVVVIVAQLVFGIIQTAAGCSPSPFGLSEVPLVVWLLLFLWPFVLLAKLEAIKHAEIKRFVRQQKLQRLNFDTKLGMNSPF